MSHPIEEWRGRKKKDLRVRLPWVQVLILFSTGSMKPGMSHSFSESGFPYLPNYKDDKIAWKNVYLGCCVPEQFDARFILEGLIVLPFVS